MRHSGLALATSLASGVNLILLIGALKKRLGRIGARDILQSLFKTSAAAAVMGGVIALVALWASPRFGESPWHLLAWVLGSIGAGFLLYGGCARLFRCRELGALVDIVRAGLYRKHI
jgi:putative peptidoglycan lipid II flippase